MIDRKYDYQALYALMPVKELKTALLARLEAKAITVKILGRNLTAAEHRRRNCLNAEHQRLVMKYEPVWRAKRRAYAKRRYRLKKLGLSIPLRFEL